MSVLLAVGIAVFVLGVLTVVFTVLSRRQASRGLAALSTEDLFARVESVPATHGDNCPWKTAALPRYAAGDAQ